jgi:hypothetical protein
MIYQYGPHPLLGDGILDHQFFWYLQDIHCRLSMNDGHVWSIFLCSFYYVMILLLFWGHEPCIGFFLWWFNMPDALICYPGSIEKLKLLGATYLPTYLLAAHQTGRRLPRNSICSVPAGRSPEFIFVSNILSCIVNRSFIIHLFRMKYLLTIIIFIRNLYTTSKFASTVTPHQASRMDPVLKL